MEATSEKEKSRSQHIREYLESVGSDVNKRSELNAKDGPSQVVKALAEKGIKVSVNLVGMVKLSMRKKSIVQKPKWHGKDHKKPKSKVLSDTISTKDLLVAKKFLESCNNDLKTAKNNLEVVSKLLG